jgi:hypothetical protein
MNQSIFNHLFLPHYLPSSTGEDFLIEGNHQNEYKLLKCIKKYLNSFQSTDVINTLPIFTILTDCIERWSALQNPQNISVSYLQTAIEQLPPGKFLPLYFHAQNAAILIEMDANSTNQPLISAWQVLLPTAEVTSSLVPHLSCFPVAIYRLKDRSQLSSKSHCELLMDFMKNTIEYSKSHKASREVDEIRDVPESHYVYQWWIQHFDGIKIENGSNLTTQFTKKHRDHIRWNRGLSPFRRSGLWMTIKTVLHTIIIKRLGHRGTVIYKLLITHFLAYVISITESSSDLLVYGIRKIVRRLNKIESLLSSIESNDVNEWIQHMKQEIQRKIDRFFPKLDWQKRIQMNKEKNLNMLTTHFERDRAEIYQHLCLDLKAYLNSQIPSEVSGRFAPVNNYDISSHINQEDYIPSYDVLTKQLDYTTGIALIRIELWAETHLEQWINRTNCFEILLRFYERYQTEALNYYWSEKGSTDPIGYSRFILTSLTIIRSMHEKLRKDTRFARLKRHSICIPNLIKLFEFLVLPNREDMIRAPKHYDYFREFSDKQYPDLLSNVESADAFGVYYAARSSSMNASLQQIRNEAEQDRQQKISEVNAAQERYRQLINSVKSLSCTCDYTYRHRITCHRCEVHTQANNIQVRIFECPIPSKQNDALAVIFELQMPIEVRCYRDVLWQFINRPNPNPDINMYEWLSVPPHKSKLMSFYTASTDGKVQLVSPTKSMTQSHYSYPPSIASTPVAGFLFENSLEVQISPNKSIEFEDEHRILTPQLDHPNYKQLQFTIDSTQFVQNHVIAKLSDCPPKMKPTQFVEFGSFRSGHRLQ